MKHNKSISNINWEIEQILPENVNWALPQILAVLGSEWPLARTEDSSKYSFSGTLKLWGSLMDEQKLTLGNKFITKNGCRQLLSWLCVSPRGELLGAAARQTTKEWIRYSAPVPIILSAFKQYRNVKYSQWDWTDSKKDWFFDKDFLAFSSYFGAELPWTNEELLNFRESALEVKSGLKQGTIRKPESTASVYGIQDSEFKKLPRLLKLALLQLWVFSPTLRTELMVTNHLDLDAYPKPLVETEIFTPQTEDSPW